MANITRLPRNEDGIATVLGVLKQQFGDRLQTGDAIREQHGHTTTWLENQSPDGVVFAQSNEDVTEIVKICATHKVPIIPFGTGTSLEGHVNAPAGGISVDVKDNVIAIEAVMANGRTIRTAQRAKKSSAGYDLTRLMVGSEGTLGLITEITLKLQGIPEGISSARCTFPTVDAACQTVMKVIQYGIPVARIELLDALQVKACNAYSKLDLPEEPLLLIEFHGSDASVVEQAEMFGAIAEEHGGAGYTATTSTEERNRLWQARHDAYWATLQLRPGAMGISTDVCVPISRLADCVNQARAKLDDEGFISPIVGHVGDGNFHCLLLVDAQNEDEKLRAGEFVSWLNRLAISMDGTCTGEHGIGQGKMPYLEEELGAATVDVMVAIKTALDPDGIMNPGKVVSV